jgi:hypothetical protein
MIDGGYFVRQIIARPKEMVAPGVREICSVSECMSSGPDEWIQRWQHNGWGWFNRIADALGVVPPGQESVYRLFAYRMHPEIFTAGGRLPLEVPDDVRPEPVGADFRSLGFDSAGRSMKSGLGLECSPLSCNGLAAEIPVNEYCLFPGLPEAIAGAERFAVEQPEPGDYYVVEVLEANREAFGDPRDSR